MILCRHTHRNKAKHNLTGASPLLHSFKREQVGIRAVGNRRLALERTLTSRGSMREQWSGEGVRVL